MNVLLPGKELLKKTGDVDYFDWNYRFPISIIQQYRFKKITELLGNKKYSTLLEVGTGSGIFLPELSKHCDKLFACDIYDDYSHIEKLCEYYSIANCTVNKQNIEKTTYTDNFFDVIIGVSVLEFVNNIHTAIDEIKRIMKPNGFFITICPMQSEFLDSILSLYSSKKPKEEFGNSRLLVTGKLEANFNIIKKGYMVPFIGTWFPVYTHYVLSK